MQNNYRNDTKIQKGTIIELNIESLDHKGLGIAHFAQRQIKVAHTLPEEIVSARIFRKSRKEILARKLATIKKSSLEESSICGYFPLCGGCNYINVSSENQLKLKTQILQELFSVISEKPAILSIIPSLNQTYFRNKMEFAFGGEPGNVYLGLKKRYSFFQVIRLKNCFLFSEKIGEILDFCADFFSQANVSVWDYNKHPKTLKHLINLDTPKIVYVSCNPKALP